MAESVLTCFRRRFPERPPITAKDVENLKSPEGRGGSRDAHNLLQKLMALQQEDERWFVRSGRPVMQLRGGGLQTVAEEWGRLAVQRPWGAVLGGAADTGRGVGRAGAWQCNARGA